MKAYRAVLLGTALLLAAGCGSAPTRFYALTPLSAAARPVAPVGGEPLQLGLGPVELPKALDRPEIVLRQGPNEFSLGELDHWAEPLSDNFVQVLAENLAVLLPLRRVLIFPWEKTAEVDYQLLVKVIRFDRTAGGDAVLETRWSLRAPGSETELLARTTHQTVRPADDGYPATVAALNRLIGDFSREVAGQIRRLRAGGDAP